MTFIVILLLAFLLQLAAGVEHFIYWNSTSTSFAKPSAPVEVNIGDVLKMVCPDVTDSGPNEYLVVYEVGELAYSECMVESTSREVLRCGPVNNQEKLIRAGGAFMNQQKYPGKSVAQMIRTLNPTPQGKEFQPGQTVYYITTSNGKIDGMNLKSRGLCVNRNMRVAVKVSSTTHHSHHHHQHQASARRSSKVEPTRATGSEEREFNPKFRRPDQLDIFAETAGVQKAQVEEVMKLVQEGKEGTFQNTRPQIDFNFGTNGSPWAPVSMHIVTDMFEEDSNPNNNHVEEHLAYQRDDQPDYEIHEDTNSRFAASSSTSTIIWTSSVTLLIIGYLLC